MTEGSTHQGPGPDLQRLTGVLREHPAALLSGAYLAVTSIGMLTSYTLFDRFGVNIFQFAHTGDFLLAAIRSPIASFSILLAVPFTWFVIWSDGWMWERFRFYRAISGGRRIRRIATSPLTYPFYFAAYAWVAAVLSAGRTAGIVRAGEGTTVEVELQSGNLAGEDGTGPIRATLLGTTTGYVFLYDPNAGVTAVPVENLASLSFE